MSSQRHIDLGLFLLRVMTGVVFVFHGSQKLFGLFGGHGIGGTAEFMEGLGLPYPVLSATMAGGAEFLGGLALITGIGARLAALPLTFTMLVAAFTAHTGFAAASGGMEFPLLLAVVSASLGLLGPGAWVLRFAGRTRRDFQPAPARG